MICLHLRRTMNFKHKHKHKYKHKHKHGIHIIIKKGDVSFFLVIDKGKKSKNVDKGSRVFNHVIF